MTGVESYDRSARRWMLGLGVLLALAVAVGSMLASGTHAARVGLAQLALLVGLPAAILGEFLGPRRGAHATRAFAIACAGAWLAVPLGGRYDAWRAERTRTWCEEVAARVGTFAETHGRLPFGLVELGAAPQPRWSFPVRYRALNRDYTLCFDYSGDDGRTSGYNSKRDLWWVDEAVHGDAWVESLGIFAEPLDPW